MRTHKIVFVESLMATLGQNQVKDTAKPFADRKEEKGEAKENGNPQNQRKVKGVSRRGPGFLAYK